MDCATEQPQPDCIPVASGRATTKVLKILMKSLLVARLHENPPLREKKRMGAMKPEKGSGKVIDLQARREAEAKDRQLYSKAYSRWATSTRWISASFRGRQDRVASDAMHQCRTRRNLPVASSGGQTAEIQHRISMIGRPFQPGEIRQSGRPTSNGPQHSRSLRASTRLKPSTCLSKSC